MRSVLSVLLLASFTVFGASSVFANDCVSVDIEVPSQLVIGSFFTFSADLTNCGDQATMATFAFSLSHDGQDISLPPTQVRHPLAAGQDISTELNLPVPPALPTGDYELCVTVNSGSASSSDCADFSVVSDGGTLKIASAASSDCLNLDVEVSPQLVIGDMFTLSTELTNCGDAAALVNFAFSLSHDGQDITLPPAQPKYRLAAGQTASQELQLPVPPALPTGQYELCVTASYGDASSSDCADFEVTNNGSTLRIGATALPDDYKLLEQNTPNPFNPSTDISFVLQNSGHVTLKVYDITGRNVKTLVDDNRGAGTYKVTWDGTNTAGTSVASGIYFYRIDFNGYSEARKMVLLK